MRAAFVTVGDTGRRTGGYLYNARVIAGLRERGAEVEEVVAGGASPKEQLVAAPRLGARLEAERYDMIVVDALARVAVASHLDRWRAQRPVVALVHELPSAANGGTDAEAARERAFEEPLLRADRLISVSEHGKGVLVARGVPAGRVSVVPPGFDRLARGPGEEKPPGAPVRALCVGQWIPRKNVRVLVEAWVRLGSPDAVLELIGETDADPEYASGVRSAIAVASGARVVVRGAVDDDALARAYARADLFVLPSRYEGYGIVYAEALAHGLPVVACNVGPVPNLVGREAARLVAPDDAEALRGTLEALIRVPGLRKRMSRAARRRAGQLPRWEDTAQGFAAALHAAVAGRAAGRSGAAG